MKFRFLQKRPEKSTALLLQDAERHAAYFNRFKARILHAQRSGFRKDQFEKYYDDPEGKRDELAKQFTNERKDRSTQSSKDVSIFGKEY